MHRLILAALAALLASEAPAEVRDADKTGFTVHQTTLIGDAADEVWAALTADIANWWASDLTVSGDASRMRLDARPGGCLCEDFGAGSGVEHLRVTGAHSPFFIRLTGAFGPLGLMGVDGNMTIEFADESDATRVELVYAVGGYSPDGLDKIAPDVDRVLGSLLDSLRAYVEDVADGAGNDD